LLTIETFTRFGKKRGGGGRNSFVRALRHIAGWSQGMGRKKEKRGKTAELENILTGLLVTILS